MLLVVHVHIRVKSDSVPQFIAATQENARNSLQEPGIARFDLIQQADDPTRFVLTEVYRSPEAPAAHKETAHYKQWRDTVEPWMAEPRRSQRFQSLFPDDAAW